MHKTRQILTRPSKASDMNNKLHVSTYNETITRETNQHPNEKHTAKRYSSTTLILYIFPESIRR